MTETKPNEPAAEALPSPADLYPALSVEEIQEQPALSLSASTHPSHPD